MQQELIALEDDAKVWIYQANKEIAPEKLEEAIHRIEDFLDQWTSHSRALKTYGNIFHNRFLTLFVDESQANASGCAIDSSVRFVLELGKFLEVDFFDRLTYTYMIDEKVYKVHHHELAEAYASGKITDDTLMFDNLVKTKDAFLKQWLKPLRDSWHYRFVKPTS